MAGYRAALLNFTKGEISPELEARFDLPAYQAGMRRATNVKVRRTGGVSKRMGTRFVAQCLSDSARLIPFQFSDEQGYALEFGQAYMRPLALGGAVLEEGLRTTAISKAANAQITAAYHGYSVGDQVYLQDVHGMTEINDRWLTVVSVIDANRFTVNINSTGFSTWTSDTGTVRVGAPPAPPAPPTVPPPIVPTPPPPVGSGSGGGYVPDPDVPTDPPVWCVTSDTLIRMADHSEKPAGELRPGDVIWTQHEATMAWGRYPVTKVRVVPGQPVFTWMSLRATGPHRVWVGNEWRRMKDLGLPDGSADVVQISVAEAHTYVSGGILSHNLKSVSVE